MLQYHDTETARAFLRMIKETASDARRSLAWGHLGGESLPVFLVSRETPSLLPHQLKTMKYQGKNRPSNADSLNCQVRAVGIVVLRNEELIFKTSNSDIGQSKLSGALRTYFNTGFGLLPPWHAVQIMRLSQTENEAFAAHYDAAVEGPDPSEVVRWMTQPGIGNHP